VLEACGLGGRLTSMSDEPGAMFVCGVKVTKKIRTLSTAFVLFTTIATAQLIGALLANSVALLADTASMFLDAVTYAVNIYAEAQPQEDKAKTQRRMLIASGVSFFTLLGITLFFLIDGIMLLQNGSDGGDVNPYIVLGFAIAGIIFDFVSLLPYCIFGVEQGDPSDHTGKMNMCSALVHLVSDTLRSFTTLIESILIILGHVNGTEADAVASIVVSSLIIVGLIHSIYEWAGDVYKLYIGRSIEGEKTMQMEAMADESKAGQEEYTIGDGDIIENGEMPSERRERVTSI